MNATELFDRTIRVIARIAGPVGGSTRTDTVVDLSSMDARASITKSIKPKSNRAELAIMNLSEATRGELERGKLVVQLFAGYAGVNRQVFVGDVKHCRSRHDGHTWITEMEMAEGARATRHARLTRSYRAGTKLRTILADLTAALGWPLPPELSGVTDLDAAIPTGETVDGQAADELGRLLRRIGLDYSLQDGGLQVLADGQTRPDRAWIFGKETGMVGSPSHTTPQKGKKPNVAAGSLLYPELLPGGLIDLRSKRFSGPFKLLEVAHTLDTAGPDWKTEIEATPVAGAKVIR